MQSGSDAIGFDLALEEAKQVVEGLTTPLGHPLWEAKLGEIRAHAITLITQLAQLPIHKIQIFVDMLEFGSRNYIKTVLISAYVENKWPHLVSPQIVADVDVGPTQGEPSTKPLSSTRSNAISRKASSAKPLSLERRYEISPKASSASPFGRASERDRSSTASSTKMATGASLRKWKSQQCKLKIVSLQWEGFVNGAVEAMMPLAMGSACDLGPLVDMSVGEDLPLCWAVFKPSLVCFRFCGSDRAEQAKVSTALEFIYGIEDRPITYRAYCTSVMVSVGCSVISYIDTGKLDLGKAPSGVPSCVERSKGDERDDVGWTPYVKSIKKNDLHERCLAQVSRIALMYVFKARGRVGGREALEFFEAICDYEFDPEDVYKNLCAEDEGTRREACEELCSVVTGKCIVKLIACVERDPEATRFVQEQVGKAWLAYLHVTGRRALSPFLSCTAYMPGMLSSHSSILTQTVIPQARNLLTLHLSGDSVYVTWIDNPLHESSHWSIVEREILLFADGERDLSSFSVYRGDNPFRIDL